MGNGWFRYKNYQNFYFEILILWARGGGIMTPHDYGYLPPGFLMSYPVSEWNFQIYTLPRSLAFFRGFFGEICCYANFLCYANFSIVFYCFQTNCFWGRGKFLGQIAGGENQQSAEQCIETQKRAVFKGNRKAWFPFTANSTTTTQKTKRLCGWSVILPTNRFVCTSNYMACKGYYGLIARGKFE